MSNGPIIFALLVGGFTALVFIGFWRITVARDLADTRLKRLGETAPLESIQDYNAESVRKKASPLSRLVNGFGFGPRLAVSLAAANLSTTASEYVMIIVLLAVLGFAIGFWRGGLLLGLVVGAVAGYVPIFYLSTRAKRRKQAFANQLPEVLTLLVGALRAGHGLSQAMIDLTEQMPPPASEEFGQVVRAVNLGVPISVALNSLSERIGTGDIELIVTAIVVQSELGGNLATTLETISDTIRDRIRMKREIRVLTSQQRLTGGVLALTPAALAVILSLLNPSYMKPFFEPGWIRLLPILAVVMQIIGFVVIRKIMDIEV
ncbi:MAG: type II secretion system F family protein [Chloroflexi bacterium]|nr:type II secretion system F family protein [Chloroflexota bacterium]